MERVLIIGNGYAGLAAARILAAKNGVSVTMTSAEKCPAYIPHLLPELVAGKKEAADLSLAHGGEYAELKVDFRAGAQGKAFSAEKRTALLSTGETVTFDKALIAAGAIPYVPRDFEDLPARCENVFLMKRLLDALLLRKILIQGASRIVIVGAGRVGMLLAEALKEREVSVTVVEIGPEILATMLQADVAALLHPVLRERRHLRLCTGARIESIAAGNGRARDPLWHEQPFFAKFLGDGILLLWDAGNMADRQVGKLVTLLLDICNLYHSEFISKVTRSVNGPPQSLRCRVGRGSVFSVNHGRDYVGHCINVAVHLHDYKMFSFGIVNNGFNGSQFLEADVAPQLQLISLPARGIKTSLPVWVLRRELDSVRARLSSR